jgi:hypothetical protein
MIRKKRQQRTKPKVSSGLKLPTKLCVKRLQSDLAKTGLIVILHKRRGQLFRRLNF